jgi:hypothetical protein
VSLDRMTEAQYAEYLARLRPSLPAARLIAADVGTAPSKPSKYRNRRTADGFDSEKERDHWTLLELRARAGEITELQRQVKFALVVNGIHIADYVADHVWREGARLVVADTKSVYTRKLRMYVIKKRLMQACHGIQIEEL